MPRKKSPARRRYDTDLTDAQWEVLAPLIPDARAGGRPRKSTSRELVDAILYFLRAGVAWRLLPHDLPPWQTVYYYLRRWQREGVWEHIHLSHPTPAYPRPQTPLGAKNACLAGKFRRSCR